MTTISYVRACNPQTMVTFADDLTTKNDHFSYQVEQMNRSVDTSMDMWKGDAATAASARSLSQEVASNHLSSTIVDLADVYNTYGGQLDGFRGALIGIVDNDVPHAGMTVDDEET